MLRRYALYADARVSPEEIEARFVMLELQEPKNRTARQEMKDRSRRRRSRRDEEEDVDGSSIDDPVDSAILDCSSGAIRRGRSSSSASSQRLLPGHGRRCSCSASSGPPSSGASRA